MKLLDEKGRLFGRINIVDLAVIIVVIAAVAGIAWKIVGGRVTEAINASNNVTVTYEVFCEDIDTPAADYCAQGDLGPLMSSGDILDGQITGVQVEPYYTCIAADDGSAVMVPVDGKSNLTFTIEVKTAEKDNAYPAGTQEIRVGKPHIVKTTKIEVSGIITAMEVTK